MKEPEIIDRVWAAIKNEKVIETITMVVPHDVDFDSYRESALSTLGLLSDNVKTGQIISVNGERFFMQRQKSHQNRSKKAPKSSPSLIKL